VTGEAAARARRRGRALALGAAAIFIASCAAPSPAHHPNVVWIVIDALRADALHVYGYPKPITPAIDALAAEGVRFENHFANAAQTVPSTLIMLLSRRPSDHGFSPPDAATFADRRPVYPAEFEFFAEVLHDAGYATAGYTANPYLTHANGFDQGFDTFGTTDDRGDDLVRRASAWLDERKQQPGRPFHLYLHLMDVHQPYDPPVEYLDRLAPNPAGAVRLEGNRAVPFAPPSDLAYNADRYAACVAYADGLVASVLAKLDALGLREDTIVVFTADHGEEFGEHGGIGHGRHVFGEVVRVPLILRWPGHLERGRVIEHVSQHLDLAPAVLALAGVARPATQQGRTVFEPIDAAFLEMGPWRGVVVGDDKLVWDTQTGEQQLFAITDRLDRHPRDDAATTARLRGRLETLEAQRPHAAAALPAAATWSEEEKERLRALGYAR
jgi:arylsulfatase